MADLLRQAILRWGSQQTPKDYTEDTDWPTTEFGLMAAMGEPNHGTWSVRVPDGDVPDHRNGGQKYLAAHNTLNVTVGSNTLYRGRIAAQDVERGDTVTYRNQRWAITLSDYNDDLRGIVVHNFHRGEETDSARVQGIVAHYLSGDPRPSTNLNGSNYVITGSNAITMPAKTYTAQDVDEVLTEIAQFADKEMFVDVDGNLHYHGHDYTGFDSILRISDDVADLNSVTCLTINPQATEEGREHVTALRTYYGPGDDNGNQHTVFNQFSAPIADYWEEINNDSASVNAAQAAQNAANLIQVMHQDPITYSVTVGMPGTIQQGNGTPMTGDYVWMLKAGQRIGFKSKAARGGYASTGAAFADSFFTTHIRSIRWTMPTPDAYYAHLELERPRRISPRGRGNPVGAKPAPECEPTSEDAVTPLLDSTTTPASWPGSDVTTGSCWGGDHHMAMGASGGQSSIVTVAAGDVIVGSVNFREQTGDDSWENVNNYNYVAYLEFSGSGMPLLTYTIVDQRYHNAGCIHVNHSETQTVPAGYTGARIRFRYRLGGIRYTASISEVDAADVPENDPDCIPAGSGGDSPFFARSDDPRFDNDDQHLITKLQQRVTNSSGGALNIGDVVIPDITQDDPSVTTTTEASTTDAMVGIVTTAMADGETGVVMWSGKFQQTLNIDGTPAVGDYLATSTSAGAADVSSTRDLGSAGRVISVDADDNTTFILWWGIPDGSSGGGVTDHGALTGLADDDHTQYVRTTLGGRDVVSTVAAAGSTETLDLATANFHDVTLSADCTLTLTGATNGVACYMEILLRQGTGAPWEVTWPASVAWVGGSAPTLQTGEDEWDLITLVTRDGGTVWFAESSAGPGGSSSTTTVGAGDATALFPDSTISLVKDAGNPTFNFNAIPETVTKVGDTYYGAYQTSAQDDINLATATDRDGPWTAYASNPIYSFSDVSWAPGGADAIYAAEIIEDDGTFYLFYGIYDADDGSDASIGFATATAIIGPYTDNGAAILSPGAGAAWDSLRVGEPSVLHHDGRWVMAYMGESTALGFGAGEKIGIATASTPGGTWTKAAGNPLIDWGAGGAWDNALTADPFLFFEHGYYWCWYTGGQPTPWNAGLAYTLDPTTGWTKHTNNPLLSPGGGGSWDDEGSWRGSIFIEDGLLSGVYGGIPTAGSLSGVKGGNFRLTVTAPPNATAHIADTSDAHDASAISIADAGGHYTGTDVEAALQEVAVSAGGLSWIVDPGAPTYSGTGPVTVALTSVFGIDGSGNPYYNAANVTDGEEAALVWDSDTGTYLLRPYYP